MALLLLLLLLYEAGRFNVKHGDDVRVATSANYHPMPNKSPPYAQRLRFRSYRFAQYLHLSLSV